MDYLLGILTKWQPLSIFVSAVAALVVAFVAIYQDRLRALVYSPILDLKKGPFYPDSVRVPLTDNTGNVVANACYLQIRVKNKRAAALKVEVFVEKIEKEINSIFRRVDSFYPLNLKWRHYDTVFLDRLSPGTSRDCTLGRIVEPQNKHLVGDDHPSLNIPSNQSPFRLELATVPNTRCDLLAPGKYRLYLEIGASNARHPQKRKVELEFGGTWLQEIRDMAVARNI